MRGTTGAAAVAVLLSVLLAACGTAAPAPAPPAPADGTFPVTITHALGSATIPARPERIVALSFEEDVLSQVGVRTVGHADNSYAPGTPYPWQEGEVDLTGSTPLAGTGPLDLEQVAALRPDLILATNHASLPDVYDSLSRIAPTVAYASGWGEATWEETARVVGRAIGREAEVEQRIAEVDGYVAGLAAQLPGLAGKTFSSVYYYETDRFAVDTNPDGQTARLLGQLGLVMSPRIVAEVVDRSLSAEQVGLIDADLVGLGFAGERLRAELTASPLFRAVPAVRDGRVHETDDFGATAGNNPTLLNVRWQLERQRAVLQRVAAR